MARSSTKYNRAGMGRALHRDGKAGFSFALHSWLPKRLNEPTTMPDPSSSRPYGTAAATLDGEVIPPTIRVVNPERQPPAPPVSASVRFPVGTAVLAGLLVAVVSGGGALEAYRWHLHTAHVAAGPSPTALALARLGKDVGDLKASVALAHQDEPAKALRKSVDQLRAELDALRTASAASVAQLSAKLDAKPAGSAASDVVARLDKIDHDPRLADIASRLDRIERQVSATTPTGSIATPSRPSAGQSVVTQALAAPQRPAKLAVLDNWIVRDVYSGIALVEGRSGSVREVVPGESLPGAGEVQSIQRHGRSWVVVTSRGIIDTETW